MIGPPGEFWGFLMQSFPCQTDGADLNRGDLYTARLTLDVTPALRARIKVSAFTQNTTVAELLRALLEREFPEKTP